MFQNVQPIVGTQKRSNYDYYCFSVICSSLQIVQEYSNLVVPLLVADANLRTIPLSWHHGALAALSLLLPPQTQSQ